MAAPSDNAEVTEREAAFPIVGIGASAGGLEALRQLLAALPVNTGMGFVIVQHLAPEHASSLAEILSRATKMLVCEVRDEPEVEPNHVYVIPPARDMTIAGGKLQLLPQERRPRHRGIDQFFRSLAEDCGHKAIGVVLSGSATDGTLGIEEIKGAGGITFAQDDTAQHESMPQSAVASGCVDFVLPPAEIAAELARIARHPYVAGVRAAILRAGEQGRAVREDNLRVRGENGWREVAIEVIPLKGGGPEKRGGFVVLFDEGEHPPRTESPPAPPAPATGERDDEIIRLTQELEATREYLQSVIEQQDASNEELQSTNEEAQSANEEMQSVNEELETSKEEIQSTNEELATVNDELNNRNLELARLTNDLNNVLISVRMPILILDRDLRIRRFTPAAEKTLDLAAGDVGRPLGDVKMSLAFPDLAPLLREVIDTVSPRERDVQDARGRWFSLRARPYQSHENKIDGAVLTLVDIDELRRARTYADDLLAHAPVPVLVLDAALRVRTASHAFYATFQVAPPTTEGCFIYELGNREWDIPALRARLEEVLPQRSAIKDFEVRHSFEDIGLRIMLINARVLAQSASDGEAVMVVSIEDITERTRATEALRESEALRSTLIEQSPGAVVTLDGELRFAQVNPRAQTVFGHVGPLLGRPFAEVMEILWGAEVAAQIMVIFQHTLDTGERYVSPDFYERRADTGTDESYEWEIQRMPLPAGGHGVVCYFTDSTERRRLEESLVARAGELARADRSKDEFLAMLAHELRNPLAPLRNAAEILQSAGTTDDERAQAQRILSRQIENMSRMIDDLLDVSRITEGKIELRKSPVSVEAILTAATSLIRSNCQARKQELAVSIPETPIYLNADATRLEQVFTNLLGNACKYSGDGCHIWLSAELVSGSEPPEVVIRVRDDGIGIEPALLPHVFDLFVQASRTLDRSHGGLGIGLTLVQRLVKLHGGTIEAHSAGLGEGSEFIVHLPTMRAAPPPREPPPPVAREMPRRILIVDDNTDSARSMATLQIRRGHETRTAFTGPEAVAVAAEFLPEVVLLDIGLPGMDGYEVARQLRALPALRTAFLVAMTGYGGAEDRVEARLAGFDEYLVKPIDLAVLREWLRRAPSPEK